MKTRSFIVTGLLTGSLMLPFAAQAQTTCDWGPNGNCGSVIAEQLKNVSVDLESAVKSAQDAARGTVQSARLSPFGLPGEEDRTADAKPTVNPTYLVSLMNDGTRSLVSVDARSGKADVVGTATGALAKSGAMGWPRWHHRGDDKSWGGKGGFGPAEDMKDAKVDAVKAIATAKAEIKDARPVMVRGVKSGNETAWMVAMKTTAATGDAKDTKAMTMVFVDATDGKVLNTRTFEPDAFGPRKSRDDAMPRRDRERDRDRPATPTTAPTPTTP